MTRTSAHNNNNEAIHSLNHIIAERFNESRNGQHSQYLLSFPSSIPSSQNKTKNQDVGSNPGVRQRPKRKAAKRSLPEADESDFSSNNVSIIYSDSFSMPQIQNCNQDHDVKEACIEYMSKVINSRRNIHVSMSKIAEKYNTQKSLMQKCLDDPISFFGTNTNDSSNMAQLFDKEIDLLSFSSHKIRMDHSRRIDSWSKTIEYAEELIQTEDCTNSMVRLMSQMARFCKSLPKQYQTTAKILMKDTREVLLNGYKNNSHGYFIADSLLALPLELRPSEIAQRFSVMAKERQRYSSPSSLSSLESMDYASEVEYIAQKSYTRSFNNEVSSNNDLPSMGNNLPKRSFDHLQDASFVQNTVQPPAKRRAKSVNPKPKPKPKSKGKAKKAVNENNSDIFNVSKSSSKKTSAVGNDSQPRKPVKSNSQGDGSQLNLLTQREDSGLSGTYYGAGVAAAKARIAAKMTKLDDENSVIIVPNSDDEAVVETFNENEVSNTQNNFAEAAQTGMETVKDISPDEQTDNKAKKDVKATSTQKATKAKTTPKKIAVKKKPSQTRKRSSEKGKKEASNANLISDAEGNATTITTTVTAEIENLDKSSSKAAGTSLSLFQSVPLNEDANKSDQFVGQHHEFPQMFLDPNIFEGNSRIYSEVHSFAENTTISDAMKSPASSKGLESSAKNLSAVQNESFSKSVNTAETADKNIADQSKSGDSQDVTAANHESDSGIEGSTAVSNNDLQATKESESPPPHLYQPLATESDNQKTSNNSSTTSETSKDDIEPEKTIDPKKLSTD